MVNFLVALTLSLHPSSQSHSSPTHSSSCSQNFWNKSSSEGVSSDSIIGKDINLIGWVDSEVLPHFGQVSIDFCVESIRPEKTVFCSFSIFSSSVSNNSAKNSWQSSWQSILYFGCLMANDLFNVFGAIFDVIVSYLFKNLEYKSQIPLGSNWFSRKYLETSSILNANCKPEFK